MLNDLKSQSAKISLILIVHFKIMGPGVTCSHKFQSWPKLIFQIHNTAASENPSDQAGSGIKAFFMRSPVI